MSQIQSAPRWGVRARVAGLLALATTALAAFGPVSPADAAFTTGKCAGPNIIGRGGSFARDAQTVFNFNFKNLYCAGTSGAGTINVTYEPLGSGAGVKAMEIRTDTPRFGGSDDPPTPSEVALMNSGGVEEGGKVVADKVTTNDGKVHAFPIAVGSVVAMVNFPDGCNPELLKDEYRTVSKAEIEATPAKKALLRIRIPKTKFEKIWAGEENAKWSEAFPELVGAACEVGITRVVRFDQSGTTFAFKDYLNTINEARGWKTTYSTVAPLLTRAWPNAEFGAGGQCGATEAPGKQADNIDHLTTACANGNGELVKKLAATDGSIGYSDLATARNASPSLAIDATKTEAPTTPYWTQVQNGSGNFTEPTADEANGYKTTGGSKGANCLTVSFKNLPSDTFGSWANTSGVNASSGYGICTLTYAMAFDDNAAVWGNTPEQEALARTVKDYEESLVSDAAQGQLFGADYAPLPAGILAISRTGVDEIGWNKSSDGCSSCNKEEEKAKEVVKTTPPSTTPPSNQFSLLKKTISSKSGGATLSVKLPGAGKLDVLGTAKAGKKKITVGHVVLNAGKGGTFNVTLKPSAAAKQVLAEKGKLNVTLKLTFSPTGGTAKSSTSAVTLKLVTK